MKYIFAVSILFLLCSIGYSQQVPVIKITDLEKRINASSDTLYIVNFWATWCAPCVKELPDFDSINTVYANQKIKVLLVSLDFKEDSNTKLIPFIATKKIKSEVVLLDELNANYFIPRVSSAWSGAIPRYIDKK
jgi:thiol-disulfide isomerase/thioredoxin